MYFGFEDRFQTSFALVNVYLYADKFNEEYFKEFSQAVWPEEVSDLSKEKEKFTGSESGDELVRVLMS